MAAYSKVKTLRNARTKAITDARTLVDEARERGDVVLMGDADASFNRACSEARRLELEIMEAEQEEARASHTATAGAKFAGGSRSQYTDQDDAFAEELWEAIQPGRTDTVNFQLPASRYVSPTRWASGGDGLYDYDLRALGAAAGRESRTTTPYTSIDASTTYSSYTVPTQIADVIEEKAYQASAVLQAKPHVFTTDGINPFYIPKVVTDPTITLDAEGAAPANSAYVVFGHTLLKGWRVDAYSLLTEEDISASGPDMLNFVIGSLASYVGQKVAGYLATGAGTTEPYGLFTCAATGNTAASQTAFTADEVVVTYQSINAAYRPGLACVASQAAESTLMLLKSEDGRYLYQAGLAYGQPSTLLGVPLFIDPQGPAVAASKSVIVFFQPEHYHVRYGISGKPKVDVSTDVAFTSWTRAIRCAMWVDAGMGVAGAATALTMHA